jgi:hypothetical protein
MLQFFPLAGFVFRSTVFLSKGNGWAKLINKDAIKNNKQSVRYDRMMRGDHKYGVRCRDSVIATVF